MTVDRSVLDARRRDDVIGSLRARDFDMLVIGGGITGVGVALDAVSRGLTVGLVEAGDLATGTSSRSGKVFHGGLRYLEQLNFGLVRDALIERDLMVDRLCPHLTRAEPFVFPFTNRLQRPYIGAGVALYDLLRLTGTRAVPAHRHLSKRSVLQEVPALRADQVKGGVRYYDVRVDDARHTMMVARTAAGLGAIIATRAKAVGVLNEAGRVRGLRIRDLESAQEFDVSANVVVNAAGVWSESVQRLAGANSIWVTPAKGVHLVVPGDRIDSKSGLITRTKDSVFIIRPWFGRWLMGTTDTPAELDDEPSVTKADVDYLLGEANRLLDKPLGYDDVIGAYAGLRPLVGGGEPDADAEPGGPTAEMRRDHTVLEDPIGLVTVVGGKYTTYRLMAKDAVDVAAARLRQTVPASSTDELPIHGGVRFDEMRSRRDELAEESGLAPEWIDHLLGRYGTATTNLLDLVDDEPELGRPLVGAPDYLAAEVRYAAVAEGASRLEDVLVRRTRIAMETADRGTVAAEQAGRLLAETLGWSDDLLRSEVETYRATVAAQRESEQS